MLSVGNDISLVKNEKLISIARIYGTPLYVYDTHKIVEQISCLRKTLPNVCRIFYSMKVNPSIGILSYMKNYVSGVEVASDGELYSALHAGISPQNIIFVGPGKTDKELEYAINNKILSIVVESMTELEKINSISKCLGVRTKAAIRVNPKREIIGARIKMGGTSTQFGIDEENLSEILTNISLYESVSLQGLHIYTGTQILDAEILIDTFENMLKIARNIKDDFGVNLELIDFGGGFGVPYFPGEKGLNLKSLHKGLESIFQKNLPSFDFKKMRLIVESGRFLIAESGFYLTKVLYKKRSRGKTYLVTNGGSNHHASAAGIGRFIRHNFPIFVLNKNNFDKKEKVNIVGPLCTPTDILAQDVELPIAEEGDIIAIPKSGAYGLTASMTGFLSHSLPAEVLLKGNKHCLIRERGKREDFLLRQFTPNID